MTASSDPNRRELIRELLGRPEYRLLFGEIRRRMEEGGIATSRSVKLSDLNEEERRAVADLHGWQTLPGRGVVISFARLDEALRGSRVQAGLAEVVEALGGPVADRRAERAAAGEARQRLWEDADRHPALDLHPELREWLDEVRRQGLLTRASRLANLAEGALLEIALAACLRLPANGLPLSVLAAELTGDAHALDPGQPLAGLLLRAAAKIAGWREVPSGAAERRHLWGQVGVLCDPLSSHALVLNLRPVGNRPMDRHLREWADLGEPRRITLREMRHSAFSLSRGTTCFICENPGIVTAAADRLGERCAPLLCTEGMPSAAVLVLVGRLANGGAVFRFHADFDWNGLRIGNILHERFGASPWRFTSSDYRQAVERNALSVPLAGVPPVANWDPDLGATMLEIGCSVFEEHCLDDLLEDLADSG